MKPQPQKNKTNNIPKYGGGVIVSKTLTKVSERVDNNQNIIDPVTKRIIKKI